MANDSFGPTLAELGHRGEVLDGMMEINGLVDLCRVKLEFFDRRRNTIPNPWRPSGDKQDLIGGGDIERGQIIGKRQENSVGTIKRTINPWSESTADFPFTVQKPDVEQLGFSPGSIKTRAVF